MQDPFVGTWRLNTGDSQFDPNHHPSDATMVFELGADGRYVMRAEGVNAQGQKVAERPQTMIPDGKPWPSMCVQVVPPSVDLYSPLPGPPLFRLHGLR